MAVLITLTYVEPEFVTYANNPFGVTATEFGVVPTATVAITALVAVLTTLTEFAVELATYAKPIYVN